MTGIDPVETVLGGCQTVRMAVSFWLTTLLERLSISHPDLPDCLDESQ
jgi:hypothetical protein